MDAKTVVILTSIPAAQSFLESQEGENEEVNLVSTHCNVADFLMHAGYNCLDLSSYISTDDVRAILEETSTSLQNGGPLFNTLKQLDKSISAKLAKAFDLDQKTWFCHCYEYILSTEYVGSRQLLLALQRMFEEHSPESIVLWGTSPGLPLGIFNERTILETEVLNKRDIKFTFQELAAPPHIMPSGRPKKRNLRSTLSAIRRFLKTCFSKRTGKRILLMESLYDLSFLKHEFAHETISFPSKDANRNANFSPPLKEIEAAVHSIVDSISYSQLAKRSDSILPHNYFYGILSHFRINAPHWFKDYIDLLKQIEETPVDMAIWGNSPTHAPKNWIVQFLIEAGIPVLGMQHGSHYGINDTVYRHILSDFNHCTHFFSYGFTGQELAKLYPDYPSLPKIIPVGSTKSPFLPDAKATPELVDAFFPMTIGRSLLKNSDIPPHELAERQRAVLSVLEKRSDLRTLIKPIKNPTEQQLLIGKTLNQLTHCEVIYDMWLPKSLRNYSPKLVIIEYHSTPLYEVLPLDCDIFLLLDDAFPFTENALQLLRKRVHCFERTEDLVEAIRVYPNSIEKLRDNSFYSKYVANPNAQSHISNEIEIILNRDTSYGERRANG